MMTANTKFQVLLTFSFLGWPVSFAHSQTISGGVVILTEATSVEESVNVDGLVILEIPDSGSRPPQNIQVTQTGFKDLGEVQGVRTNEEGEPMMGGGYTWYLFQATQGPRSGTIEAQYVPNGTAEPQPVVRKHQVFFETSNVESKKEWDACIGTYAAQQIPGAVLISAVGAHPTTGYRVKFEKLPITIHPPEYRLVHLQPSGVVGQAITPFLVRTSFSAEEKIEVVYVTDKKGRRKVLVEQVPDLTH